MAEEFKISQPYPQTICPWCGSDKTHRQGKCKACQNCKHFFKNDATYWHNKGDLTLDRGTTLFFAQHSVFKHGIKVGERFSVLVSHSELLLVADHAGAEIITTKKSKSCRINSGSMARTIRAYFNLPPYSQAVIGLEPNDLYYTMKLITPLSISYRTIDRRGQSAFFTVSKRMITRFNVLITQKLKLTSGQRIVLGVENEQIYLALAATEDGYHISVPSYAQEARCSISSFGEELYKHFNKEMGQKHRFLLDLVNTKHIDQTTFYPINLFD